MSKKEKAIGSFKNSKTPHSYMWMETSKLKPYTNNSKKHPVWQVNQIKASIEQFGFISPIVVDSNYRIIAGHGRHLAALRMELKQVPIILVDNLSEAEVRAYRIADNQLSMNTEHDMDILRIELKELDAMDLDFNLEITGISTGKLDIIIGGEAPAENDEADIIPDIKDNPITKNGDMWILGDHLLLCGSSLEQSSYVILMQDEKADAIFTDPPYNVPVNGHVCGNGKIKHDEFAMASGEMSDEEFQKFLFDFMKLIIEFSKDGSLHYIFMDWRNVNFLLNAASALYKELKNICVWNKSNGGMGSLYRSKHEFIPVFKNGSAPHTNNIELGKHGRYRSNVWDYPGVNSFNRSSDLEMHPTVKPTAMIADAIMDCTNRSEIILDPFGGSGSTIIAAEMVGRRARLIELEPQYCDVTIKRWQDFTGKEAIHSENKQKFNDIKEVIGDFNEQ